MQLFRQPIFVFFVVLVALMASTVVVADRVKRQDAPLPVTPPGKTRPSLWILLESFESFNSLSISSFLTLCRPQRQPPGSVRLLRHGEHACSTLLSGRLLPSSPKHDEEADVVWQEDQGQRQGKVEGKVAEPQSSSPSHAQSHLRRTEGIDQQKQSIK